MSSLLFTRKITQKTKWSPLDLLRLLLSVCVIKGTKPTHSTWKSRVCHHFLLGLGLPPPNSLQVELFSHTASPKESHVEFGCHMVRWNSHLFPPQINKPKPPQKKQKDLWLLFFFHTWVLCASCWTTL